MTTCILTHSPESWDIWGSELWHTKDRNPSCLLNHFLNWYKLCRDSNLQPQGLHETYRANSDTLALSWTKDVWFNGYLYFENLYADYENLNWAGRYTTKLKALRFRLNRKVFFHRIIRVYPFTMQFCLYIVEIISFFSFASRIQSFFKGYWFSLV